MAAQSHAMLAYLSGPCRGRTVRLSDAVLRIARRDGRIAAPDRERDTERAGTLHRSGAVYELVASDKQVIHVNGARIDSRKLENGDLIEIENGPVIRYRVYAEGRQAYKSVAEVLTDCIDCAKQDTRTAWLKFPGLVGGAMRDLATQTSLWFRASVVVALALMAAVVSYQAMHARDLEARLRLEQDHIGGLTELLRRFEGQAMSREELAKLRGDFERGLTEAGERVARLEALSAASARVIAEAAGSVAFVQGSFGFQDPSTKRALRMSIGSGGRPQRLPDGRPMISLEGDGPLVEIGFTGTAFVIHRDGLLLTNRHVALPWEGEESLPGIRQLGLAPVVRRLQAYLPAHAQPFDVKLVGVADDQDLAILRGGDVARERTPLRLAASPPAPGEEAIVLGFPTGIRALLARAGDPFVRELGNRADMDIWGAARELARAGLITPLASRGIVAQVTGQAIVYDAATTSGGSGGPVMNLRGEVVAVNRAILPEFGGSNLGVPVAHARALARTLGLSLED